MSIIYVILAGDSSCDSELVLKRFGPNRHGYLTILDILLKPDLKLCAYSHVHVGIERMTVVISK